MVDPLPDDVTPATLRGVTLSDLIVAADEADDAAVEAFLAEALAATNGFLAEHGKRVSDPPAVSFDRWESGVSYDPYAEAGELLVIGGPRGLHRGGERVLYGDRHDGKNSLLTVLGKGLLHSYNQSLVAAHYAAGGGDPDIDIYAPFQMLRPAVDEGITQLFVLYVDGDVTDRALRDRYVDAWAEWFEERTDADARLFRAVAYAVGERIEAAEGTGRERFVHGLKIQEPLIKDGDTTPLSGQLRVLR
jgi:hypothetical protein